MSVVLTVVHVTGSLASPAAAVGTTLQLGVLTVGVSAADDCTYSRVAGRQCLRRARPWPDDVELVEKVAAFTASRYLGRLLSITSTFS